MNLFCCLRPPPVPRHLGPTLRCCATPLPVVQTDEDAPDEPDALHHRPQLLESAEKMGLPGDKTPSQVADEKPPPSQTKRRFKASLYVAPQSLDSAQPLQTNQLQEMAIQLEAACKPGGRIAPSNLLQFGKNLEIKLSKTLPEDRLAIVLNFMAACHKEGVKHTDLHRRTWALVQSCMKDIARHSTQKLEPFFHSPDALAFALGGADDGPSAVDNQLIRQQAFLWAQKYLHAPPSRSDRLFPTIKNIYQHTARCLTDVQQTLLQAAPTPTGLLGLRYALAGKKPGPSLSNCLRDLVQAWPAGMRAVHRAVSRLDPAATEQWLNAAPDLRLAVDGLTAQQP